MTSSTTTEMVRLHVEDCLSLNEIAERYGVSKQAVWARLKRAGVTVSGQRASQAKQARFARLQDAHSRIMSGDSTLAQEAERLGYVNGESLRRVLFDEGLSVRQERPEPEHGTTQRYRRGCKCQLCRDAHAANQRRLVGKVPPNHGTSGYRNYKCRCRICSEAHSAVLRERRRLKRQERRT